MSNEYPTRPDVLHSLHCLNAVRKRIAKTLYALLNSTVEERGDSSTSVTFPPGWEIAHLEHCMDRILQALMCHGDLTPSPLYF